VRTPEQLGSAHRGIRLRDEGVNRVANANVIPLRPGQRLERLRPVEHLAKGDRLRAVPEHELAELLQSLAALDDRGEVIAGELPGLACEAGGAVGKEQLCLADAAGVQQELAGRGIARRVLRPTPTSSSPKGIHADWPLQRAWMILLSSGSSRRNAATV